MTLTWRAVSPSSLSVWLNDPKFSNEQRMASVRCFSRMNDHRLFMPPWLPALTSMGGSEGGMVAKSRSLLMSFWTGVPNSIA